MYNEHEIALELKEAGVSVDECKSDYLKSLDKMCAECSLSSNMLCEGIRPFVDVDSSKYANRLRLVFHSCAKRRALEDIKVRDNLLVKTWIPKDVIKTVNTGGVGAVDGISGSLRASLGASSTTSHFEIVCACARGFKPSRYVYVPALLQGYNKFLDNMVEDLVYYPELLVVDCLDLAIGAKIRRETLISCLEQRVAVNKTTIVGISDSPKSDNPREQRFYDEVMKWNLIY